MVSWDAGHDGLWSRGPPRHPVAAELLEAQLAMRKQMRRFIDSAEIELMKVMVSFGNELDTATDDTSASEIP